MANFLPAFDLNVRLEDDDDGDVAFDLNDPLLGIWHAFCMAILLGSLSTGAPASEVASRRQPSTSL